MSVIKWNEWIHYKMILICTVISNVACIKNLSWVEFNGLQFENNRIILVPNVDEKWSKEISKYWMISLTGKTQLKTRTIEDWWGLRFSKLHGTIYTGSLKTINGNSNDELKMCTQCALASFFQSVLKLKLSWRQCSEFPWTSNNQN